MLAHNILERLASTAGLTLHRLTPAALSALSEYPFPGNVRELENVLERALALLSGDVIEIDDLHLVPVNSAEFGSVGALPETQDPLQDQLDRVEKQAILDALQKTRFNRTAAAKLLGVTFRSLRYRMKTLLRARSKGTRALLPDW